MADYLNNDYLTGVLLKFRSDPKNRDVANELANCFYQIADGLLNKYRFDGINDDDARQEAVATCWLKVNNFNIGKGRAFNFYTTVILNTWRQMWRTNQNYHKVKDKFADHLRQLNDNAGRKTPKQDGKTKV
jgi:DNA-directed RNA polymerase specialized sigma24 family protein